MYEICPKCGAHLDPEERCSCGEPVFRLIVGSIVQQIDLETFMEILGKMNDGRYGK